ncbi:MAG: BON domain-containing protein [Rickettsiaceae bacterium]|nr:BON domain-containing protein [Rickettsiaceae bacterium]
MKHLSKILLVFFVLLFQFNLAAKTLDDKTITNSVKKLLVKENDIPNIKIKVNTKNGVVYLSGSVDTRLQENRIIELAASIEDVVDVDTKNLNVVSSSEFLADSLITAKAKGRIKYLSLNKHISEGYNLHVETTNKVVHIFGDVKDKKDIETIKKVISDIVSVEKINMNIKCQ